MSEQINKEQAGGGARLADGFGCPMFFELYEQEVVSQLRLGEGGRIAADVLMDESELSVIRVPGTIGVVAQSQMVSKPSHGGVRLLIVYRVGVVSPGGPDRFKRLRVPRRGDGVMIVTIVCVKGLIGDFHAPLW